MARSLLQTAVFTVKTEYANEHSFTFMALKFRDRPSLHFRRNDTAVLLYQIRLHK